VVSADEFVETFLKTYRAAVRTAERIVGARAAEDAVMDAVAYLWARRDTLTAVRPRLFLIAVRQRAHHHRLSAWRRHLVPTADLGALEEVLAGFAAGEPRPAPVRLPEGCIGCGSDITPGNIDARYCGECRARTCRECQRYGGVHDPSCSRHV
jgi:hypothetical protein